MFAGGRRLRFQDYGLFVSFRLTGQCEQILRQYSRYVIRLHWWDLTLIAEMKLPVSSSLRLTNPADLKVIRHPHDNHLLYHEIAEVSKRLPITWSPDSACH